MSASKEKLEEWRGETASWHETYVDEKQKERRRREMPKKLEKLGVTKAERQSCIYDLCCGSGETLATLHELGFRNLHGVDFLAYEEAKYDDRFTFQQGDVRALPLPDNSADWILNIHALHHLETPENVRLFLDECYRLLKPGGRLGIVDFPGSPQIHIAFRMFFIRPLLVTPYLRWFANITRNEWHFLKGYLAKWGETRRLLHEGKFHVVNHRKELFLYYLTLEKPL